MTTIQQQQASISPDEAKARAQEAWIFGMPLVYIEIQIDTATHVPKAARPVPDQPVRSLSSVSATGCRRPKTQDSNLRCGSMRQRRMSPTVRGRRRTTPSVLTVASPSDGPSPALARR